MLRQTDDADLANQRFYFESDWQYAAVGTQESSSCQRRPVFVKVESTNPSGSMKDRMALAMIQAAEEDGRLTADAMTMARRLAREKALFAGTSTGANVFSAIKLSQQLGSDSIIVTLACDSGMKYLGTSLYREAH